MIGNEYSNKTLKQNLIDGLSKKEFILSKFYTIIFFSLISTIIILFISLILGYIYSSYNELGIVFREVEFVLAYCIKLIGFFSFCLFLGVLAKRSAFALAFLFIDFLFEWIVYATHNLFIGYHQIHSYDEAYHNQKTNNDMLRYL